MPNICSGGFPLILGGNDGGVLLPLGGEWEANWPTPLKVVLYLLGLFWLFDGVGIIADRFMGAIERITSTKKRVHRKDGRIVTMKIWNDTVANLTLMALGSSAPEILLSLIELVLAERWHAGALGPSTIVGSAAFNLLIITGVCVSALPDGEMRAIKHLDVFAVTAVFSILAYVWLLVILVVITPDVVTVVEGLLTLLFCPLLVFLAWLTDKGYFHRFSSKCHTKHPVFNEHTSPEEYELMLGLLREKFGRLPEDFHDKQALLYHEFGPCASRAAHRAHAMRMMSGGNEVLSQMPHWMRGKAVSSKLKHENKVGTSAPDATVGFASPNYAVVATKHRVTVTVTVQRHGDHCDPVTVRYATRDGTALVGKDYRAAQGVLTFEGHTMSQTIDITVFEDKQHKPTEEFFVDLRDVRGASVGKVRTATVVVLDADGAGTLAFAKEEVKIMQCTSIVRYPVVVHRKWGALGKVTCSYRTEDDSAKAGRDYVEKKGTLEFEGGATTATIELEVLPKGKHESTEVFRLILEEPTNGAMFDPDSDGGLESDIMTVVILNDTAKRSSHWGHLMANFNFDELEIGHSDWSEQFIEAIYVGGSKESQQEAACSEWLLHIVSFPWKLLFACVPPAAFWGGWLCFFVSLFMIGLLTTVIGDLANLLGCSLDMKAQICAVTFVALGTSLPQGWHFHVTAAFNKDMAKKPSLSEIFSTVVATSGTEDRAAAAALATTMAAIPSHDSVPGTEEGTALYGLSTKVADERLVEEVEVVVSRFLKHVKTVTWRSRLSFLQTQEGSVTLFCGAAIICAAAYTLDYKVFAEVVLVLPFHFLAWYISFRLPRAEQLRAIAKVRECLERFNASSAQATRPVGNDGDFLADHEAVPPSSFCVSVLRDRAWRQIPYNILVEGDVFKLRDGEVFPCRAERLVARPGYGAVPTGESHDAGTVFLALGENGGRDIRSTPTICSFRAQSTACLPMVTKFLQTAQKAHEGRMDSVFFELAALARGRLKRISLAAFLATATAFAVWLLRPAVWMQSLEWHLHRALLPFRLVICLLPLMPVILLQITDVWGNARIQSLFEWHAGLADDERDSPLAGEEAHPGSGEIDASSVPIQWQLRQLIDILRQGLDGPTNLMHTLNSTTVVCFCDKEGLLTDTCTTVDELCVCSCAETPAAGSHYLRGASASPTQTPPNSEAPLPSPDRISTRARQSLGSVAGSVQTCWPLSCAPRAPPTPRPRPPHIISLDPEPPRPAQPATKFRTIVLDVQSDKDAPSGLRFEHPEWRNCLPLLKPLGLGMAVSRQPKELTRETDEAAAHDLSVSDLLQAMHHGYSAAMHDCLCNVSQLIGFRDEVLAGFQDTKFCMEICRPVKSNPGLPHSSSQDTVGRGSMSPGTAAESGRPHTIITATDPSPSARSVEPTGDGPSSRIETQDFEGSPLRYVEYDPHGLKQGATNFSQTLMSWFVEDTRDGTYQMFCKAKPKRLLPKCTHFFNGSKLTPLRAEDKQELLRIVLQWKASGLQAVAYAYRPLTNQPELELAGKLGRHTFFCSAEGQDGGHEILELGHRGAAEVPQAVASAVDELQSELVLLGMAGVKLCASVQMASYAEALQGAGIRFQVYSPEGEKRTRTLGAQLGLETGWNCMISLEPKENDARNMMGQVVLPSGIPNIRKHTREVDNVPLLVSLYSKASPWRAQQMISILQENAECVTCVGSALQPNFETFRQANISVSVLVGNVPQCRRCLGRREPRVGQSNKDLLLFSNTVMRAEYQLAADLTSLPCALQARHSYTNGEQRTLGVLFNAIKEARRCVDSILMVIIHYISGAVELAVIIALQSILCLPAPLEGLHIFALLFVLLPTVSLALLFNAASPQLMKELPLKKQDEKTLAQPGRLMLLYTLRSVPSALVVITAFIHDLHRMFAWQLEEAQKRDDWSERLAPACEGFTWLWWLSGEWPQCTEAMSMLSRGGGAKGRIFLGYGDIHDASCALAHAQQWGALLFVVYEVYLAFTFLDRYDSLLTRGPLSNKVLCIIAFLTLLVHLVVSALMVVLSCGTDWHHIQVPRWEAWLMYLGVWPLFAICVSECTKRRDRRYHLHLQKTLRVIFNTRLGMWSPK